ncbi:hypothetical protein WJT74_06695 [Sphingomicrobium sp. XHP0239]|uniref:hypothetical protein n=1 Tax=Sphingomicrobium maritimum TaxID=3133972 RepID=UPI0031CCD316
MRHQFAVMTDDRSFPRRVENSRSILRIDADEAERSHRDAKGETSDRDRTLLTRQQADRRFIERAGASTTMDASEPEDSGSGLFFWFGIAVAGVVTTIALVQSLEIGARALLSIV